MEGYPEDSNVETCLSSFNSDLSNVLSYLTENPTQKMLWVKNMKTLYDHLVDIASYNPEIKGEILLPELLVDGFDDEQMWQQIELINNVLIRSVQNDINKSNESVPNVGEQHEAIEDDAMDQDNYFVDNDEDNQNEIPEVDKNDNEVNDNDHVEDNDVAENDDVRKTEDIFFDINEMDKILDEQERKEVEGDNSDDDDDVDEPDIFNAEDDDEEQEDEGDPTKQSTAEKERLKLEKKISLHEEESLQARPWQMKGESAVKDRDTNALLGEDLQFEHGTRPAPEVTLETTNALEKLIIERVKAKLFDDVERKEKPVSRDMMKNKPLDQEKSQLSLAEVYEKDYIAAQEKQHEAKKEEIDVNQEEIKRGLDLLFRKLDALSNFVYTPKAVKDDIKIIVNAPAISMEEAIPTGVADSHILAPNEIKAKEKEELRTTVEETSTDKKRKRRKIKKSKSIKSQEREITKLKKERNEGAKKIKTKSDAIKTVENEVKQGISLAKQSSEKINSNFFSKLQDSVDKDPVAKKKKKSNNKFSKF